MKWSRAALLAAVLAVGCEPVTKPDTNDAVLHLSAVIANAPVDELVITVTAADIPTPLVFNITVTNGSASGTLRIPPGAARRIFVEAFNDAGEVTHDGEATVDVERGQNPPVSILLRPRAGQVPIVITLAEITVDISPGGAGLAVGDVLQLTATIYGPNQQEFAGAITWATTNPAFASVTQQGFVTALAPGEVLIVAVHEGVAGVSQISVLGEESGFGEVVITEIFANPNAVADDAGEWIELHNPGAQAVDLSGWTLTDDGTDVHQISSANGNTVIPPGGYAVFGINAEVSTNGGVAVDYEYSSFQLANTEDEIILRLPNGSLADAVAYESNWTVPVGASLALDPLTTSTVQNDFFSSWCPATTPFGFGTDFGTPGFANPTCPSATALNETDLPAEADICTLIGPLDATVTQANGATAWGGLYEAGLTEPPAPAAVVVGSAGYGPPGTDPRLGGWVFVTASYTPVGPGLDASQDQYYAPLHPPPGTHSTVFRFSLDQGQTWTYCDKTGSGSAPGFFYEVSNLGSLTVTP